MSAHDRNTQILMERIAKFDAQPGARNGDFVRTSDGQYIRICHVYRDHVQTTDGRHGASYHLGSDGYLGFSGGLDVGLPKKYLRLTAESRDGSCWFFDRGIPRAHAGVDVTIPCRVYACDFTAEQCRRGVREAS